MTRQKASSKSPLSFLDGGGAMGELARSFDWSATALGKPETWPQSLRVAVRMLLNSRQLMFIWWGPEYIQIYNDDYSRNMGPDLHPASFGVSGPKFWGKARTNVGPQIESVMAGGEAIWHHNELVRVMRDGQLEEVWWDYGFTPIDDENSPSGVGGVLLVCNDVTALRLAERNLARIWQISPVMKVVASMSGTIAAVNPAWSATLGWSEYDSVGHAIMEFVAPEDEDTGQAGMKQLNLGNSVTNYPIKFVTKAGERRTIAWTTVPENRTLYGFGRDITGELEAAKALKDTEEALRQSHKMEAIGQLTGGLAHDFNNLLAAIMGSMELVQRKIRMGNLNDVDRYIESAISSGRRAAALTARLLAFGRRQSLDGKPLDLNALVGGMEDLLRRTLGETIVMETHLDAGLWTALSDSNQLESALLNLTINARDAMPRGGTLSISTSNVVLDEAYTRRYSELKAGEYVVMAVSDTGEGMPADVLDKAFDPFFTTKPLGQGTGLGLSMIYGFAKQARGHVRIHSEVGIGTTVKLFMPRFVGGLAGESVNAARAEAQKGAGERILVIEDDPTIRMLIMETMAELGYRAYEAFDGTSAMVRIDSKEPLDLLVTDVGLPGGMNGRQIAEIARQKRPELRVLFLTGYAQGAEVRGGFLEPGMAMITKPFELAELADKIQQMLGRT